MEFFHLLPTGHDSGATAESNVLPFAIEVLVVDGTNVAGLLGERNKIISARRMIVVCHGIRKATSDSFRNIYKGQLVLKTVRHCSYLCS